MLSNKQIKIKQMTSWVAKSLKEKSNFEEKMVTIKCFSLFFSTSLDHPKPSISIEFKNNNIKDQHNKCQHNVNKILQQFSLPHSLQYFKISYFK